MKLYTFESAPNPRRVQLFMRCKGIELPTEPVDLRQGRQHDADFLRINPRGTVPALVLDDGQVLTDSLAICGYLEECHPQPPLMGTNALERALVRDWHMRIFVDGMLAGADALRNGHPAFAGRALPGPQPCPQIPDLAERGGRRMRHFLRDMDAVVARRDHLVGDGPSLADIDLLVAVDFGERVLHGLPPGCERLQAWRSRIAQAPGAT